MNWEVRLGSLISHPILPQSLISLTVSVDVNLSATKEEVRAQVLKPTCEQGGGPGLSFPIPFCPSP